MSRQLSLYRVFWIFWNVRRENVYSILYASVKRRQLIKSTVISEPYDIPVMYFHSGSRLVLWIEFVGLCGKWPKGLKRSSAYET